MKKYIIIGGVILISIIEAQAYRREKEKEKKEMKEYKEVKLSEADFRALVNDLHYGVPEKRREAAEMLGESGESRAVSHLIKALKDEVWFVREASAEALGSLGHKKAIKPLQDALKDPSPEVRFAAGEALARLREASGLSIIVQAIRDTAVSYKRRARIAEAMGILKDRTAEPALIAVLDDPVSPRLREKAAYALGKLKSIGAVPTLISRLDYEIEDQEHCRVAAAIALGEIGDKPRAIPALVKTLDDPSAEVREAVSKSLEKLIVGDRKVIPILIEMLESEETRVFAETALDEFFNVRRDVPLLSKIVGSNKKNARLYAITRLEEIKEVAAVYPLVEAMGDPDSIVRARAAIGLGKLGFPVAVPHIIRAIEDTSLNAAKSKIIALGEIRDPGSDTTLYRIMKDEDKPWELRILAAQSIGKFHPEVTRDTLLLYLRDKDWKIRYLACVAFGESKDKEKKVVEALAYMENNEKHPEVRDAARIASAKIHEKPFKRKY